MAILEHDIRVFKHESNGEVIYSAWEPSSTSEPQHVITRKIEGVLYGLVSSRMPNSAIRFLGERAMEHEIKRHFEKQCRRAYQAIFEAYPELCSRNYCFNDGKIVSQAA